MAASDLDTELSFGVRDPEVPSGLLEFAAKPTIWLKPLALAGAQGSFGARNWYPDCLSRVSPHRHDNWTLLLSLGSPRVLSVDRARVLMEPQLIRLLEGEMKSKKNANNKRGSMYSCQLLIPIH